MTKNGVAMLLIVLTSGCATTTVETSPDDPSRVTRRIQSKKMSEDVVSRGVKMQIRYTLEDRSGLKKHSDPVCLLAGGLPEGAKYQEVGRISAVKRSYGNVEDVFLALADEGRRIGVDAITGLQSGQRRGAMPWRFSAPSGAGMLVKLADGSQPLDCVKVDGQLF